MSSSPSWTRLPRKALLAASLAALPGAAAGQCVNIMSSGGSALDPMAVMQACRAQLENAKSAGPDGADPNQVNAARRNLTQLKDWLVSTGGASPAGSSAGMAKSIDDYLQANSRLFAAPSGKVADPTTGKTTQTEPEKENRRDDHRRPAPTTLSDIVNEYSHAGIQLAADNVNANATGDGSGTGSGDMRGGANQVGNTFGVGGLRGLEGALSNVKFAADQSANAAKDMGRNGTGDAKDTSGDATTQERLPPAVSDVRKAERLVDERYAGNPAARRLLADQYNRSGSYEDAARVATQVLRQNQNDPAAYTIRAKARALAGDRDGAVDDASKALKLQPENQLAALIVGNREHLASASSRIRGARLDFGAARSAEALGAGLEGSGPSGAGASGGYVGAAAGWLPGAAAPKLAYTALPLSASGQKFYDSALMKHKVGDNTGALMDVTRSIGADPQSPLPLVLRAQIDRALDNPQGALDDSSRALQLAPQDPNALRERALAFMQLGRYDEALKDLSRAMELEPGSGTSYLYRAMVYEKQSRVQDALDDLAKAVMLEPALKPLADEISARLRASKPGAAASARLGTLERKLVRGGAVALATLLLLFGLLGTAKGRSLVTTTAKRALAASDATMLEEPAPEVSAGTVLGGVYRIDGELGRGGMGVVYDAYDTALQRRVAIKRLQRDALTTNADLERLLQEARTAAKLRHPRLAEIFNVLPERDLYLVFERVDGETLDRALLSRMRFSVPETRRMLGDIGAAIGFAHAQRIIHRDLKPSNVMVEPTGACKVMDFGIAHQASSAATVLTRTSASGTPPYMAPEQAMGSVSKASDLYAMAVMAYELLLGRRPFQGPDFLEQKLNRSFAAPSSLDSALPKALDAFFAQALDPDPTKRPSSADEFLARFDRASA